MIFGFDLLSKWKPTVEEFTTPFVTPLPFRPQFDCFPKGIDNVHIDVVLSAKLVMSARRLIQLMIRDDANKSLSWKSAWVLPPNAREINEFLDAYESMMETAVGMARKRPARELLQLVQFAALKRLLILIGEEIERFRDELQQELYDGRSNNKKTAQTHDQIIAFGREMPAIRHRVTGRIFAHIIKLESANLRKVRKSILGYSWPIPREVLFNPILLLPSLWNQDQLMPHYPLVGVNSERLQEFAGINQVIVGLFSDYLPEWVQPPISVEVGADLVAGKLPLRLRTDQGNLPGFLDVELLLSRALREEEYQQSKISWLDDPANLSQALRTDIPETQDYKLRLAFRNGLLKEAQKRFNALGLLRKIYAAHIAPTIFEEQQGQLPVHLIVDYLEGVASQRTVIKRLGNAKGINDPTAVVKRLNVWESSIRHLSQLKQYEYLADFMVRFVTLRRDLKLAYRAYWSMNQIHILSEPNQVKLARSNHTLQEFLLPEERFSDQSQIRGHAILKADLRGSSRIIRELRERNLNSATHFSLNFFDPITNLLERFGAKKVFVEGDAVILSIYEYEESPQDWLAVARAAGLACDILNVVDRQNAQNRRYGLPELELGMGIAWLAEAPAFLYDGDHEITISAAINRADRLSSCAASLRKTSLGKTLPRGVEVAVPVRQGIMQKESGDDLLRYNVNGIELDPAAFPKLQAELVLHKVGLTFPQYSLKSVFYIGRYPDKRGQIQWLVIREAPVWQWVGDDVGGVDTTGRVFYEIISDADVIEKLKVGAA